MKRLMKISGGLGETRKLAEKLARTMPAKIYALTGELGSGKTAFVRFFLRALRVRGHIVSPTFILMRKYVLPIKCGGGKLAIYHIDTYRLRRQKELLNLGFKKIISDPCSVVLIEWADRVKRLIPKEAVWIYFEHGNKKNKRTIKLLTSDVDRIYRRRMPIGLRI